MARPDRRDIDPRDVAEALASPHYRQEQPDGRFRHWMWISERKRWLRVVVEPDGETVHIAFWDRRFKR